MKFKGAIAFFLVIILSSFVFSYLNFSLFIKSQKSVFRQEVIRSNTGLAEVLEIDNSKLFRDGDGIEWKEKNKELVINGKYFEVIKVDKGLFRSRVFIIRDEQENALFANYFSEKGRKDGKFLNLLFSLLTVYDRQDNSGKDQVLNGELLLFGVIKEKTSSGFILGITQPPRFIS